MSDMDWTSAKTWAYGLLATIINGFASGIVLIVADPAVFNLQEGWQKLLTTSALLGLLGAANYLKQHPLPDGKLPVWLLPVLLAVGLTSSACATTQVQTARKVSVDIHATLAAVQDAEAALYASGVVPAWTAEKHRAFNAQLVIALKAGRAFNEAVRMAPEAPAAQANLATISTQVAQLAAILVDVLPPGHPVAVAVAKAKDAILALLPIVLPGASALEVRPAPTLALAR
jgi:hypothetical protein